MQNSLLVEMKEMDQASQQMQYGMWNSTIAPFMFQAQNTLSPIIEGHAHDENLAIHTPMGESPHLSFTTSTIISKNTEECPESDTWPASPYNVTKEQRKRAKKACVKCRNRKKGCKQDREILCSRWPRTGSEFADTQVRYAPARMVDGIEYDLLD